MHDHLEKSVADLKNHTTTIRDGLEKHTSIESSRVIEANHRDTKKLATLIRKTTGFLDRHPPFSPPVDKLSPSTSSERPRSAELRYRSPPPGGEKAIAKDKFHDLVRERSTTRRPRSLERRSAPDVRGTSRSSTSPDDERIRFESRRTLPMNPTAAAPSSALDGTKEESRQQLLHEAMERARLLHGGSRYYHNSSSEGRDPPPPPSL